MTDDREPGPKGSTLTWLRALDETLVMLDKMLATRHRVYAPSTIRDLQERRERTVQALDDLVLRDIVPS